jgi:hypothetical protein
MARGIVEVEHLHWGTVRVGMYVLRSPAVCLHLHGVQYVSVPPIPYISVFNEHGNTFFGCSTALSISPHLSYHSAHPQPLVEFVASQRLVYEAPLPMEKPFSSTALHWAWGRDTI